MTLHILIAGLERYCAPHCADYFAEILATMEGHQEAFSRGDRIVAYVTDNSNVSRIIFPRPQS